MVEKIPTCGQKMPTCSEKDTDMWSKGARHVVKRYRDVVNKIPTCGAKMPTCGQKTICDKANEDLLKQMKIYTSVRSINPNR